MTSVGPPRHYDQNKDALYPDTADAEDFSRKRAERLLEHVRGKAASDVTDIATRPGPALGRQPATG